MRLNIDPDSGVPVYLQIARGIKRSIALGSLRAGEQLPSVREVAERLTVNPNTVAKAYQHLERDGVVTSRQGVGTFIRDGDLRLPERERRRLVREMLDRALVEADHLQLSAAQVRTLFLERLDTIYSHPQREDAS